MPKMKTRSGMKKRVRKTASGLFKHKKQNLRHILTKKNAKRKRHLRKKGIIHESEQRRVEKMICS